MTCNILVSRPLKCHLTMRAGGYYLHIIIERLGGVSDHPVYDNLGCGTKKCMRAGDGQLLYYKSWPYCSLEGGVVSYDQVGNILS